MCGWCVAGGFVGWGMELGGVGPLHPLLTPVCRLGAVTGIHSRLIISLLLSSSALWSVDRVDVTDHLLTSRIA